MKIGIVGAGQLGRMLALAGYPLGMSFVFQDGSADAPGAQIADIVIAPLGDLEAVARLARDTDVVTIDVENVPARSLERAARIGTLRPPVPALVAAQDRIAEKRLFDALGIPTPDYRTVDSQAGLEASAEAIGLPCVLKMRRMGYDGRGQAVLREPADLAGVFERFGGKPMILEGFVPFDLEVSQIAVRGVSGETAYYPLTRNTHVDGILGHSVAPYDAPRLADAARNHVGKLLEHFDYTGVMTVEFFVSNGQLIANEIAPRVHNSGHWTIEGAMTSQFENHLRAVAGLPLGSTDARGHSAMVNLIGELPSLDALCAVPAAHPHLYGKSARPLRKLGHVTLVAPTAGERDAGLATLLDLVGPPR